MKNKKLKNQIFFARQFLLKKNRKGFLLAEETLKIILAVISIGFLVYFLGALYFANQNDEKLEQAKASLEHLVSEINSMEEGEVRKVEIYNPSSQLIPLEDWFITNWPHKQDGKFPESCNKNKCVCICEKDGGLDVGDCNDEGICLENDFMVEDEKIKIENPPLNLLIDKLNKKITKDES